MSGFSSLNVGTRALFAAQQALDTTGQNVSNANTEGYSRQRVVQSANGSSAIPAMFSRASPAGDGVNIDAVQRIRDEFAEARAQSAHSDSSAMSTTQQVYGDIETTFGEPSSNALQAQMASFWNAWDDVAQDPGSGAARSQLLEQAGSLAGSFNALSGRLSQQWTDNREQLSATASNANAMAANVAKLNGAIRSATTAGLPANDLSDQRDLLVLKLGESVGAVATHGADGTVNLTVGGSAFVTGESTRGLAVSGPVTYTGSSGTVSVVWDDGSGYPVTGLGGAAAARLDAVDTTIPGYLSSLDKIASALAGTVNAQQAAGYDLTAAAASSPNGKPMFAGGASGPVTAATLKLAFTDPNLVAASSAAPPALDGDNALLTANHSADVTGADASYRSMIVSLGVQAQSVNNRADVLSAVATQADNARQSTSGVSLDEEMSNLVMYQHAYESAAKFITTIDSTLSTLIDMIR